MTRRAPRWTVVGFYLLTLLASGGTAWLWWRSYRVRDQGSFRLFDARYTLQSEGGRIALRGPPKIQSSAEAKRIALIVTSIRNENLRFTYRRRAFFGNYDFARHHKPTPEYEYYDAYGLFAANELALADYHCTPEKTRYLLTALEKPEQFIVTHVIFDRRYEKVQYDPNLNQGDESGFTIDGLRVQWEWDSDPAKANSEFHGFLISPASGKSHIDPAQLPAIRE